MANSLESELRRMQNAFKVLQKTLPTEVGNVTRNRTLENFRQESFNGTAWQPRKSNEGKQRNLLISRGRLWRSLRITKAVWGDVRVGSNVDYAQIHNEGGTTHPTVTPKMRKFAWAMYNKRRGTASRFEDSVRDSDIRAYSKANNSANFWRNLALTNKSRLTVRIPKRQYMGAEPELEKRIKLTIERAFKAVFPDSQVTVQIGR